MIIGHHLIWTAYGWWLPNDPRGSMSREIRSEALVDLGELHYGRKRIQPANREITRFYAEAAESLRFNLLKFSAAEVAAIAESFAGTIQRRNYTCKASRRASARGVAALARGVASRNRSRSLSTP